MPTETYPSAYAEVDSSLGSQGYLNADARGSFAGSKPSFTIERAAKQLTGFDPNTGQAYGGWTSVGQPFTVSYAFRATEPATMPSDTAGFSRFNAAQITQAELALQAWSDVANIRFVRVGSGAYASPSFDNRGAHVVLHEIGHAIGLAHPGDYNADATSTFTYAEYYEDSRQYTVMSYFSESNTGASFGGRYAAAPMLDDIAAAQIEYGPNMTTRTGDTVYGFNSTADRAWYAATSVSSSVVFAVWDAGGTDTLDFSGYGVGQVIDLREGFFSNVGGLTGNVAIAKGAVIENAKGGAGADQITGNAAANAMFGGAGGDTLNGGAGRDYLRGEDGDDSLAGGAGFDDLHGNIGDDTVAGGDTEDWVVGGQGNDRLFGDEGHDVVLGNLGNDTCEGGVGNDVVRGGQGADSLLGGDGWDYMAGDRGDDTITGGAGMDTFHTFSGAGLDRVTDFNYWEGDRVNVLAGSSYTTYQSGADTVVDMGGGDRMVLVGVQLSSLPSGWVFS